MRSLQFCRCHGSNNSKYISINVFTKTVLKLQFVINDSEIILLLFNILIRITMGPFRNRLLQTFQSSGIYKFIRLHFKYTLVFFLFIGGLLSQREFSTINFNMVVC